MHPERKPVREEQEGNGEADQVFPAPRRPQRSRLGPGPRASEAGVRRAPPSAPELDGYAGRLSISRPKPPSPKTHDALTGTHLLPRGSNGLPLRHCHLRVLLRRARPRRPRPYSHWPGRSSLPYSGAVETAIATKLGTTFPGMLCSEAKGGAAQGLPING